MKRTTTIVLFASIFAIAAGTLTAFSGTPATALMVAPQEVQSMNVLGHVEYKLMDESGAIVQYMQGDNEVVNGGEDCVAQLLFGVGGCTSVTAGDFVYIGIGNGTGTGVGATNATLSDDTDGTGDTTAECAHTATGGNEGELARLAVTPSLVSAASGSTGAIVELETATPFAFSASTSNGSGTQIVRDSGIFNGDRAGVDGNGQCNDDDDLGGTTWDMFARQQLNPGSGITVSDGDSLSVKWTITIG